MIIKKKIVFKSIFAMYLAVLLYLLFGGYRGGWSNMSIAEYALLQMNLIPFKTISEYIMAIFTGSMNLSIPVMNLLGNLLMFMPMGFFAPLFLRRIKNWNSYILFIIGTLLNIEFLQFITKRGSFDVDDLILNFIGAVLGYILWNTKLVQRLVKEKF